MATATAIATAAPTELAVPDTASAESKACPCGVRVAEPEHRTLNPKP